MPVVEAFGVVMASGSEGASEPDFHDSLGPMQRNEVTGEGEDVGIEIAPRSQSRPHIPAHGATNIGDSVRDERLGIAGWSDDDSTARSAGCDEEGNLPHILRPMIAGDGCDFDVLVLGIERL